MTPVASFIMHTQGGKRNAFVYLQLVSALAARRCSEERLNCLPRHLEH